MDDQDQIWSWYVYTKSCVGMEPGPDIARWYIYFVCMKIRAVLSQRPVVRPQKLL